MTPSLVSLDQGFDFLFKTLTPEDSEKVCHYLETNPEQYGEYFKTLVDLHAFTLKNRFDWREFQAWIFIESISYIYLQLDIEKSDLYFTMTNFVMGKKHFALFINEHIRNLFQITPNDKIIQVKKEIAKLYQAIIDGHVNDSPMNRYIFLHDIDKIQENTVVRKPLTLGDKGVGNELVRTHPQTMMALLALENYVKAYAKAVLLNPNTPVSMVKDCFVNDNVKGERWIISPALWDVIKEPVSQAMKAQRNERISGDANIERIVANIIADCSIAFTQDQFNEDEIEFLNTRLQTTTNPENNVSSFAVHSSLTKECIISSAHAFGNVNHKHYASYDKMREKWNEKLLNPPAAPSSPITKKYFHVPGKGYIAI